MLIYGKVKWPTIFILKINALLSHFIPKKSFTVLKNLDLLKNLLDLVSQKALLFKMDMILKFYRNTDLGINFRNELKISDDTFVIGHVGSYDPLKDQITLIEAFDILNKQNFKFIAVLVGKNLDNDNNDLVTKIEEKGLSSSIHLLGMRNDIPAVMNGIDLFILSSISEAFPNVLNESMACGTPCITTDVGDASLIVKNTGWIVPPKNPKLIVDAVIDAEDELRSRNISWKKDRMIVMKELLKILVLKK